MQPHSSHIPPFTPSQPRSFLIIPSQHSNQQQIIYFPVNQAPQTLPTQILNGVNLDAQMNVASTSRPVSYDQAMTPNTPFGNRNCTFTQTYVSPVKLPPYRPVVDPIDSLVAQAASMQIDERVVDQPSDVSCTINTIVRGAQGLPSTGIFTDHSIGETQLETPNSILGISGAYSQDADSGCFSGSIDGACNRSNAAATPNQCAPSEKIAEPEVFSYPDRKSGPLLTIHTLQYLMHTRATALEKIQNNTIDPDNLLCVKDQDGDTELIISLYNTNQFSEVAWCLICVNTDPERLNLSNKAGWTALHALTIYNPDDVQLARTLVIMGANPSLLNLEHGQSPVHLAAESGKAELLKALLLRPTTHEKQLRLQFYSHLPPLAQAFSGVVEALNKQDRKGRTPLYIAAKHGNLEVVNLLLNLGADRCIATELSHDTALHAAVEGLYVEVVKKLLNGPLAMVEKQVRMTRVNGVTPRRVLSTMLLMEEDEKRRHFEIRNILESVNAPEFIDDYLLESSESDSDSTPASDDEDAEMASSASENDEDEGDETTDSGTHDQESYLNTVSQ